MLGQDNETNPGPTSTTNLGLTPTSNKQNSKKAATRRKAPICSICEKTLRINSKRMICIYYKLLTHLHCTNTETQTISDTKNAKKWIYFSCASIELPFHKVKDDLNTNIKRDAKYTNEHLEKLDELKKHISICHLNTQSMSSIFDEFQFMINQTKFDIITLSETWLKNDKHLLGYVTLPGSEFAYRNRDEKRGGGVGIFIKDTIESWKYNIRRNVNSDFSIVTMRRVAIVFFELGVVKNFMETF